MDVNILVCVWVEAGIRSLLLYLIESLYPQTFKYSHYTLQFLCSLSWVDGRGREELHGNFHSVRSFFFVWIRNFLTFKIFRPKNCWCLVRLPGYWLRKLHVISGNIYLQIQSDILSSSDPDPELFGAVPDPYYRTLPDPDIGPCPDL